MVPACRCTVQHVAGMAQHVLGASQYFTMVAAQFWESVGKWRVKAVENPGGLGGRVSNRVEKVWESVEEMWKSVEECGKRLGKCCGRIRRLEWLGRGKS